LRGDLEALRPSGFGVSVTSRSLQEEVIYVEESVLATLSRYETAIARQPNRTLHEL
jgi:hypothetical protein